MGKSSKKRERTDEDVADNHDAKPILKKSKLDSTGKAEVTKKSSKVKEDKRESATTETASKSKKEKKDKKEKKEKKEKKRKNKDVETVADPDEPAPAAASNTEAKPEEPVNGDASADKKTKKKNKKDKKKKTTDSSSEAQPPPTSAEAGDNTTTSGKPTRFICFVGNLPYTATADAVRAHFSTLQPTSVRLLTQRDDPSKSRGIAFVEFGRYDHMKTCLEKFHHTEFDDGKSPARRINVELTCVLFSPVPTLLFVHKVADSTVYVYSAGGGGKTDARKEKIKQKNAKLNEERANRMHKEEQAKKEKEGGKTQEQRDEEAIHPSRRGRVPYGRH
jgi:nucleolar protein 6